MVDYTIANNTEVELLITHNKNITFITDKEACVNLELSIKPQIGNAPFVLNLSIEANFKWIGFDESTIISLLTQNAPSLLISFARPVISTITGSSGLLPFYLPLINFEDDMDDTENILNKLKKIKQEF